MTCGRVVRGGSCNPEEQGASAETGDRSVAILKGERGLMVRVTAPTRRKFSAFVGIRPIYHRAGNCSDVHEDKRSCLVAAIQDLAFPGLSTRVIGSASVLVGSCYELLWGRGGHGRAAPQECVEF